MDPPSKINISNDEWGDFIFSTDNVDMFNYLLSVMPDKETFVKEFDWYAFIVEIVDYEQILEAALPYFVTIRHFQASIIHVINAAIRGGNPKSIKVLSEYDENYLDNIPKYLRIAIKAESKLIQFFINELEENNLMTIKALFLGLIECANYPHKVILRKFAKYFVEELAKILAPEISEKPIKIVIQTLKNKKFPKRYKYIGNGNRIIIEYLKNLP